MPMPTEEEEKNMEERDKIFIRRHAIAFLIVIITLSAIIGYSYIDNKNKTIATNQLAKEIQSLIDDGSYAEANTKLNKAVNINETQIASLQKNVKELVKSDKNYNSGLQYFQEEKYQPAFDQLTKVIESDKKNYTLAQNYISQTTSILANNYLSEAKTAYAAQKYALAYQKIADSLKLKPDLAEAKNLEQLYLTAKTEQEKQEAAAAAIEKMKEYEYGYGAVGIAVTETKRTSRVDGSFGHYRYIVEPDKDQFLWLWINAANAGMETVHVNPNDFTVSTPSGYVVNYDNVTFDTNYLDATDVPPGSYISGWLIFIVPKEASYVLHYDGWGGAVDKDIVF